MPRALRARQAFFAEFFLARFAENVCSFCVSTAKKIKGSYCEDIYCEGNYCPVLGPRVHYLLKQICNNKHVQQNQQEKALIKKNAACAIRARQAISAEHVYFAQTT